MEIFSKKIGTRFCPSQADLNARQGLRGGAALFEIESTDLCAYTVCRRHKAFRWPDILKYFPNRLITHEIVCDHVSGWGDTLVM